MAGCTGPAPVLTAQDRRWIATRLIADATGIGCGTVRRLASALTGHDRHRLVQPAI
jgi:hypothetical protein